MPYNYDSHIVPTPNFLVFIQTLIILSSAAVVALSSYSLSVGGSDYGNGWADFVAIASVIVVTYFLISTLIRGAEIFYHRFVVLVLVILGVLGWASVFISLAESIVGPTNCSYDADGNWICTKTSDVTGRPYRGTMIAEAVIGGFIFALFVINLFIFAVQLHRARCAGAPPSYYAATRRQQAREAKQSRLNEAALNGYEMQGQVSGIVR